MKTFNKEKLIIPAFLIIILSFFYFMSTEKVKPENTECEANRQHLSIKSRL